MTDTPSPQKQSPSPARSRERRELLARMIEERKIHTRGSGQIPVRPASEEPPLSYAQQRLWFANQIGAGSSYTM